MSVPRVTIRIPDLDLPEVTIVLSVWHVAQGRHVFAGDRLFELSAGPVAYDISATVTGILRKKLVGEDETVVPGQAAAWIEPADGETHTP